MKIHCLGQGNRNYRNDLLFCACRFFLQALFLGMKSRKGLILGIGLFASAQAWGGVNMPAFSLPAVVDGAVVTSESYRGNALLITFFATWCPPCLQEIPTLKDLHAKFHQQGFAVVALSVDEGGAGVVARLMHQASINYPVLMADKDTVRNFGDVMTIPTSFLVNKNGQVVKKYPGFVPRVLLEKDIESVL